MRPLLVIVGGFLGSGKTTLIVKAAELLRERGKRSAAILNDQGADLVDTRLVSNHEIPAGQVTGGCFCCRFSDLIDAAERLKQHQPDVIFAEAVGSCTDVSATTLQPLKRDFTADFQLAPYTVLVDPARLDEVRSGRTNPDMAFLFQKQMEEADLVCMTKMDLHENEIALNGISTRYVSAVSGSGVCAWLDELGSGAIPAGDRILEIDYEHYARAEAELGWLNCRFRAELTDSLSPAMVIGPFLERLDKELTSRGVQIAHLKILDESPSGYVKAASTGNGQEPAVEGDLAASPSRTHTVLLNLRAAGEPLLLQRTVIEQMERISGQVEIESFQCFRPAAPKPQWRLDRYRADHSEDQFSNRSVEP